MGQAKPSSLSPHQILETTTPKITTATTSVTETATVTTTKTKNADVVPVPRQVARALANKYRKRQQQATRKYNPYGLQQREKQPQESKPQEKKTRSTTNKKET